MNALFLTKTWKRKGSGGGGGEARENWFTCMNPAILWFLSNQKEEYKKEHADE